MLTVDQLKDIMPHMARNPNTAAMLLPFLNNAMQEFGINTPLRIATFLAQIAHESGEFRYFEELASGEAYEGRQDLGNINTGDGVRYKGRGVIQLTGRLNYHKAGAALHLDLENHPEMAAQPSVGFRTAGWYWNIHNLNELSDMGPNEFPTITKRINGGLNGESERLAYYNVALRVLKAL